MEKKEVKKWQDEEALRLVKNKDVHGIISQEMQRYSDLNAKLCGMMGEV